MSNALTRSVVCMVVFMLAITAYGCDPETRNDCYKTKDGYQEASGKTITDLVLTVQHGAYDITLCVDGTATKWPENIVEFEAVYLNLSSSLERFPMDNGRYHQIFRECTATDHGGSCQQGVVDRMTDGSCGCACDQGYYGTTCENQLIVTAATSASDIRAAYSDKKLRLDNIKIAGRAHVNQVKSQIEAQYSTPQKRKLEIIKASKITMLPDDLPPIYVNFLPKLKANVNWVEVEFDENAHLPDFTVACTTTEPEAGIPDCCSYDKSEDPTDTSTILGVEDKINAWSVLCDGATVIVKQTRLSVVDHAGRANYHMQCWNDDTKDFDDAVVKATGSEMVCGDYDVMIGSTNSEIGVHPNVCLHPDVPVHVLRGVSVETVKVATLEIGDLVIGEGKTSAVQRVEHFKVDDEACVVPKDLCGGFAEHVVVSKNHAIRCPSWPANTWTFCQPEWQRVATTKYVHVELESYIDDHLLSGSVVLESWDGYSRDTDSIEDACGQRGCPWPHKWEAAGEQRWTRKDLRATMLDSTPRLRLSR